jgi:alpha-glucoside transport system substrate-binding protein
VIHQWVSGGEPESFRAVVSPWEETSGGKVNDHGTRDILDILTIRVTGDNPPDIAMLAAPGTMRMFARDGALVALDSFLDMDKIRNEYSQAWIDMGTVDGKLYGIPYKAANKSTVWYNPKVFDVNGLQVPETWNEMIALSDQLVASGLSPWSIGMESGGTSGWPGTDWIGQLLLSEYGPEVYDQWLIHEIPWTDSRVRSAWEKFGQIALTPGYVSGGADFVLSTNFAAASSLPFDSPPKAAMYFLGSFAQGFIEGQFPALVIEEDYSFFPFPSVNPQYEGAVTSGADLLVMFNDNEANRSLMQYLATAEAQEIWVRRGGFTSTNKQVSLANYPDALAAKVAEQLTSAEIVRFDADDIWGGDLQAAFFQGILDYLADPSGLDSILERIEAVAAVNHNSSAETAILDLTPLQTAPDFIGGITEIHQIGRNDVLGTILVEAVVTGEDGQYVDKYMVTVKDETLILEQDGKTVGHVSFELLEAGQQAQIWFSGPVRESYPIQVDAQQIMMARHKSTDETGLGQEFSLAIGQSMSITGEGLAVKFPEVIGDSRCPKQATCVWQGEVSVIIEITDGDLQYPLTLTQPGLSDEYVMDTFHEYQFAFTVRPYPEAEKQISTDEYELVLIVSK